MMGLVPATSPCNKSLGELTLSDWSQGRVAGTCHKNLNWFEFVGLITGMKVWSLQSKNGHFTQ